MRILVDADACPVKELIVRTARPKGIPVILFSDFCHALSDGYSAIVTVDKGRDSVDIALANRTEAGDIVVTQDYGLAALALGKGAKALHPGVMVYTAENIDSLLLTRHIGQKVRRGGGRTKGPRKRTAAEDESFLQALLRLIEK